MADATPPIPPPPTGPPDPPEVATCYRHPGRRAGVVCQRCDRPICPNCMTAASVGFQCPECVKKAAKASPTITARSLGSQTPVVTYALIAANVIAFLFQLQSGGSLTSTDGSTVTNNYATTPYVVTFRGGIPTVQTGEWYRIFTGGFLHHDIIHIALNMFMLWLLGSQLERILGPARYAALYFVALAASGFAVLLVGQASVGASGAIFGLLGATAAYQRLHHINMLQSGLAMLLVVNLAISFTPGISLAAHVGGLVAGAIAGWAMFDLERRRSPAWMVVTGATVLIVVLAVAGVAVSQHVMTTGHGVL